MVRSTQIESAEAAIQKACQNAIAELIQRAPKNEAEADRLRILFTKSLFEILQMCPLCDEEDPFPRDRSPMREIDFD